MTRLAFDAEMRGTSSTRRELRGLCDGLRSFANQLEGEMVVVYGGNQSAIHNLEIGSSTPELQAICV